METTPQASGKVDGAVAVATGGATGGAIEITERQKEVLKLIETNNKITYRAIAKLLKINNSAVDKHMKILKNKNFIKRIGGTKGYWEVKE